MTRAKILFVDDEPRIVRLLEILFRKKYEVITATSGQEALALVESERPHVVVSDQRMPKMTGIELLSKVREASPNTVRILLTGYSDLVSIIGAVNEGEVFRFLNKPWDEAELSRVLDEAVSLAIALQMDGANPALPEEDGTSPLAYATKLLAIDGVGMDRELLEMFTEDYSVLTAGSLSEVSAILAKHSVGVIVAQFESTSEEAMKLCTDVHRNSPQTTVVLIANATDSETVVRLINEAQIYRFAMRPLAANVFRLAVAAAMKEHHRRLARSHHARASAVEQRPPEDAASEGGENLATSIKHSLERFTKVW